MSKNRNLATLLESLNHRLGTPFAVPPRAFFERDTVEVTRDLLGCLLVRVFEEESHVASGGSDLLTFCGGRIVETEAYIGEHDPAAHAARGRTAVTDILYRAGGHAYVYQIYGMHFCLNATAEPSGAPGCVLIRALEPLFGIEAMRQRRRLESAKLKLLCAGPGRLCQALGIDARLNGADLTGGPLLILRPEAAQSEIAVASGPRVGITKAADWPLRFWIAGSAWVSRK